MPPPDRSGVTRDAGIRYWHAPTPARQERDAPRRAATHREFQHRNPPRRPSLGGRATDARHAANSRSCVAFRGAVAPLARARPERGSPAATLLPNRQSRASFAKNRGWVAPYRRGRLNLSRTTPSTLRAANACSPAVRHHGNSPADGSFGATSVSERPRQHAKTGGQPGRETSPTRTYNAVLRVEWPHSPAAH